MSKPREFWISGIDFNCEGILESFDVCTAFITVNNPDKSEAIRVIDYSAYEALRDELNVYREALESIDLHCCGAECGQANLGSHERKTKVLAKYPKESK